MRMCSFLSLNARVPAGGRQNWWPGDDPASSHTITTPGFSGFRIPFLSLFPGYSKAIVVLETRYHRQKVLTCKKNLFLPIHLSKRWVMDCSGRLFITCHSCTLLVPSGWTEPERVQVQKRGLFWISAPFWVHHSRSVTVSLVPSVML